MTWMKGIHMFLPYPHLLGDHKYVENVGGNLSGQISALVVSDFHCSLSLSLSTRAFPVVHFNCGAGRGRRGWGGGEGGDGGEGGERVTLKCTTWKDKEPEVTLLLSLSHLPHYNSISH